VTYDQFPTKIWTLDYKFVCQKTGPTIDQRKTMTTVCATADRIAFLKTLPLGWKAILEDFEGHIIRQLAIRKYSSGTEPYTACQILYFDYTPAHNAEEMEATDENASSHDLNIRRTPGIYRFVISISLAVSARRSKCHHTRQWKSFNKR
jgi:hypothetical protein